MLASLPLEDIIALKLELASKPVNNRLYGLELWKSLPYIARDAAMKFVLLKVLRSTWNPNVEDNYCDARNYISIAEKCVNEKNK